MINYIITVLKVIFLLGFLIFIHEGGHFIVAKLCKIKVNEFAIGFGPTIWKKQGKQTKYALRLVPLGGFVSLEGEEEHSEEEGSFSTASIPKRMAIIVAGGLVNIMFGTIVYFILMSSIGNNTSLIVNSTVPDYAAEQNGIIAGDEIIKVNNKKINVKTDLDTILEKCNGDTLKLTINRDGTLQEKYVEPTKIPYRNTGIYLKSESDESSSIKIITVEKGSSAEKYGLKANDKIIKINDMNIENRQDITDIVGTDSFNSLKFTIERGGETLDIELVPDTLYKYYLGIVFEKAENTIGNNIYYAFYSTRDFMFSIVDNIKMLFTGNVGLDQMMGPVGISEAVASTKGIEDFIYLLALISLSLGVTNLLPFPALDGGKFVLLLLEAVRGKKLKEQTEINLQLLGFALLMMLAVYITFNDVMRIL